MKTMRRIVAMGVVLGMMSASVSFAQPLPKAGEATGGAQQATVTKKVEEMTFRAEDVEGALIRPEERIQGEQHGKTSSLMQVRGDFVDKILKSVDQVR